MLTTWMFSEQTLSINRMQRKFSQTGEFLLAGRSDISVQRPNLGAQAAQSFATIEIRNTTTTGEFVVDSIYLFSIGTTGGKFPVAKNEKTLTYTSYFGKQPVYIVVRGCLGKTIRLTDSERKKHTKNVDVAESRIIAFEEVSISEGRCNNYL